MHQTFLDVLLQTSHAEFCRENSRLFIMTRPYEGHNWADAAQKVNTIYTSPVWASVFS